MGSCFRAYEAAARGVGLSPRPWADLPEHEQQGFAHAVAWATQLLEGASDDQGLRFSQAARDAYFQYQVGQGSTPLAQESVPARDWLPWEAVVRHCLNMLAFDPGEDGEVGPHEEGWEEWARARAQALAEPEVR